MISTVILSAVALWAAGTPVQINENQDSWLGGHAFPGIHEIWVGESTLEAAENGDPLALTVVLHEVGHTTGIENERQAMCFALHKLPTAMHRFFGFRFRRIMWGYNRAVAYVNGLPPQYSQGECLPNYGLGDR